jgi:hypothetical protein
MYVLVVENGASLGKTRLLLLPPFSAPSANEFISVPRGRYKCACVFRTHSHHMECVSVYTLEFFIIFINSGFFIIHAAPPTFKIGRDFRLLFLESHTT